MLGRIHPHAELLATILLAVAAVATAWSSYQSARWSGVQANDYSAGSAARVESIGLATKAGQKTEVDVLTFTQWIDAYSTGDRRLARFYFQRFRPEFKPAVTAWMATNPLNNAGAPPTPFSMSQYEVAENSASASKVKEAEQAIASAQEANQRSDNYVLAVVLFAVALFFAGIGTKLSAPRQKMAILGLGYLIFLGTAAWVATFPVTVSI